MGDPLLSESVLLNDCILFYGINMSWVKHSPVHRHYLVLCDKFFFGRVEILMSWDSWVKKECILKFVNRFFPYGFPKRQHQFSFSPVKYETMLSLSPPTIVDVNTLLNFCQSDGQGVTLICISLSTRRVSHMFIGHLGLLFSEPIHTLGTFFHWMLHLFLNNL